MNKAHESLNLLDNAVSQISTSRESHVKLQLAVGIVKTRLNEADKFEEEIKLKEVTKDPK